MQLKAFFVVSSTLVAFATSSSPAYFCPEDYQGACCGEIVLGAENTGIATATNCNLLPQHAVLPSHYLN